MSIINVENLSKTFTISRHYRGFWGTVRNMFTRERVKVKAVDEVSFRVDAGELVGYLGPNGAGKSTTIKMLTGLLVPTAGRLTVNDHVPWRERREYVQRIGAVFGQRTTLWWDLPVIESLHLLQHIYRIPPARFRQNLEAFSNLLDLTRFLDTPVRSLSLGQRMRADLCAALLHDPDILFLDEPTIGLDIVAKESIRRFIRYANREQGTTVILTTHDLADVKQLCERVLIIDHGHLVYDGSLESLQQRFGGRRELVVEFADEYPDVEVADAEIVQQEGRRATYRFAREQITASELIGRLSSRYRIADLAVREPDIEATIRHIYEGRLLS